METTFELGRFRPVFEPKSFNQDPAFQVLITAVWLLFSPPKAVKHYPTREQSQLLCQATLGE